MKRLLLIVGILSIVYPSWASVVLTTSTCSGGNNPTSVAMTTSGATLIVIGVSCYLTCGTPSDSKGNTWTALTSQSNGTQGLEQLFYSSNPVVGASHTFSGNSSNAYGLCVQAFSGIQTSPTPLDKQNGLSTGGASSTNYQTGSITPSGNGYLIVSYNGGHAAADTFTVDSGLTVTDQLSYVPNISYGQSIAYYVQPTAAAINPQWSWTNYSTYYCGTVASFIASAGGGGAVSTPRNMGVNVQGGKVRIMGSKVTIQ